MTSTYTILYLRYLENLQDILEREVKTPPKSLPPTTDEVDIFLNKYLAQGVPRPVLPTAIRPFPPFTSPQIS